MVYYYIQFKFIIYNVATTKIDYKNTIISYPFEFALSDIDPEEATDCILGILEKSGEEPDVFEDWLKWNFGEALANKYLLPYNRKIWQRDLQNISSCWVKGKMPIPNVREILYAALSRNASETAMIHSSYYYPKHDGINSFIFRLIKLIRDFQLNTSLQFLERKEKYWIVNEEVKAKRLISTIPIPELIKAMQAIPTDIMESIARLDYNSLTTVLCEQRKNHQGLWSWLYLPDEMYSAHRIVYQGNFSIYNSPEGKLGAIYEQTGIHSPETVIKNLQDENVPDELNAVKIIDYEHTQYAYPIFHKRYMEDIKIIQEWLISLEIFSVGRFAEWKYFNMDRCIERAFEVRDHLLKTRCL